MHIEYDYYKLNIISEKENYRESRTITDGQQEGNYSGEALPWL